MEDTNKEILCCTFWLSLVRTGGVGSNRLTCISLIPDWTKLRAVFKVTSGSNMTLNTLHTSIV